MLFVFIKPQRSWPKGRLFFVLACFSPGNLLSQLNKKHVKTKEVQRKYFGLPIIKFPWQRLYYDNSH